MKKQLTKNAEIVDHNGTKSVAKQDDPFAKKPKSAKNYFSDDYETIKDTAPPKAPGQTPDSTVQVPWTDSRTGAQYLVKTNKVNPPQGDFRVKSEEAENRYRMIMGLPGPRYQNQEDRPEVNENEPEAMPIPGQIENISRQRASDDIRKQQSFAVTREPFQDEFEWRDHGSYIEDPSGRIRDKPANTIGPFGTEIVRDQSVRNKAETSVPSRAVAQNSTHVSARQDLDLEKKIGEDRGLQSLVNSTFRAIFGSQVADHIVQRAEELDRSNKVSFERQNFSRVVLESGLMRPWRSSLTKDRDDRPKKDEATAFAVGVRALEALPMGPLRSELADVPKSQRETMTLALGRTILNAMSAAPITQRETGEMKMHDDVVKSMLAALTPNLFKGLVPSELLDIRSPSENSALRVQGSSVMSEAPRQRRESTQEKVFDEPKVLGPRSIGHLGLVKRRDPFNFDHDNQRPELNLSQSSMHRVNFKTREFD